MRLAMIFVLVEASGGTSLETVDWTRVRALSFELTALGGANKVIVLSCRLALFGGSLDGTSTGANSVLALSCGLE
jgi:hypothetical protein